MTRYIVILFFSALLFYSCKKTVTLNLDKASAQIVIQGEITDSAGPYTVMVNQSVGFYDDNNFPPIPGVVVKISDNEGVTDSLTETSPGVFTTHTLQGKPGNTYTLSVMAQDHLYTAVSTMPAPVVLDSVSIQHRTDFGDLQINGIANFQDPAGVKNYYQFIEYINGQLFTRGTFIFNDRLSDGKYINNTLGMDSMYLKAGDQLRVKMNCIDEKGYNYFYQFALASSNGNFDTASPSNPATNISGGALGYFSAHTTQSKTVEVN